LKTLDRNNPFQVTYDNSTDVLIELESGMLNLFH
jgi:hypothetical protein